MKSNQKPAILITGSGPHLDQLEQMADRASYKRLIWTGDLGTFPQWRKSAGSKTVSSVAELDPDVIVVGGETGSGGIFTFPPNQNTWFIPGSSHRIHYPIVFSDLIAIDFSNSFVACSYPGSGNGIIQAVLEAILDTKVSQQRTDDITKILTPYVANYWHLLDALIKQFDAKVGATMHQAATFREATVSVGWAYGKTRLQAYGLPVRNYLWERVHKTHEPCGKKILMMADTGAKCVLVIRNPLDTLVSVAHKMRRAGLLDQ